MRQFRTLIFIVTSFVLASCGQTRGQITTADLSGSWYLNLWTTYHTLIFGNNTVFVDNNVDTVFTLNYLLTNDTLITWAGQSPDKIFKNEIISLTKDTLILDGIGENGNRRIYSRFKLK